MNRWIIEWGIKKNAVLHGSFIHSFSHSFGRPVFNLSIAEGERERERKVETTNEDVPSQTCTGSCLELVASQFHS